MNTQDIDKLEAGIRSIQGLVKVGEKVFADGKVDIKDLGNLPELFNAGTDAVKAFKEAKEMLEEVKDLDGEEAIRIVSLLFS
jgi:prefoldin subunit 5